MLAVVSSVEKQVGLTGRYVRPDLFERVTLALTSDRYRSALLLGRELLGRFATWTDQ